MSLKPQSLETEGAGLTRANHLWRTRYHRPERGRPWKEITQEVIDAYDLSWEEILGPSRKRRIVWPRQEAWWLIYQQGRLSLPEIARRFGGKDHTTVLSGVRAHEKRLLAVIADEEARAAA